MHQRPSEPHYDQLPALIAYLVDRKVDVIATSGGSQVARAAKNATSTIPIVFIGGDPVAEGLVVSLARPSGNLTGVVVFGAELMPKRVELLADLVPQIRVIALLVNSAGASAERIVQDVLETARAKGLQIHILKASTEDEIETTFTSLIQLHAGALIVSNDPFFFSRRAQLVALAAHYAVPAIYELSEFATIGV